ncbi:MAG: cysteine desulfurase [Bdellovibrionales bacterium]|nr:cysteine desulfurase [Bdellovibrionales bacterium]
MTGKYFDYNATTPIDPSVRENLTNWASEWGNPSSIHWAGRGPKLLLREARLKLATALGVSPLELVFTSGGSESNTTVLKSVFKTSSRGHFLTSQVEHPSIAKTMQALAVNGAKVDFIPVSREGVLDLDFYSEKLSTETALVSVMTANNETGHIFPVGQLAESARQVGALFHTDAVQALAKIPVSLKEWKVDYASFSAHKCYALKGVGLLYARKGALIESLILGGGQERHRRGGTENVLGIAAFGHMAEKFSLLEKESGSQVRELRDHLEKRICSEISGVLVNGPGSPRLPNTSSLIISDVDGETLLMSLDLKGYAVSTGAACSSGNPEPSPTLLAMGLTRAEAQSSLRISLGVSQTEAQVDEFVETLKAIVVRLRSLGESGVGRRGSQDFVGSRGGVSV